MAEDAKPWHKFCRGGASASVDLFDAYSIDVSE